MVLSKNVEGDGRTRETALYLKNSGYRRDHIAFQYIWMAAKGLKSLKQMLRPGENGYMYDVHMTETGTVWFKTPALKIKMSISGMQKAGAV